MNEPDLNTIMIRRNKGGNNMLIGIKATFNDRFRAKQAYNEMIRRAHDKESIEIVSRTDIVAEQEESVRFSTNWFKIFKYAFIGGGIGLFFGFTSFLIMVDPTQSLEVNQSLKFSFPMLGFVLGLLLATTFAFIKRENTIELSEIDVRDQKAILNAKISQDHLPTFESILKKHHAQEVYVA